MDPLKVLYSFPHRLGVGRICYTAWEQVRGVAAAGGHVGVHAVSIERPIPERAEAVPTLAHGRLKVPFRAVGQDRMFALHDRIVARRLTRLARAVDVVHTWPLGALETLKVARRLDIPTVLERPNAHTRFAYEVVRDECLRLGVELPADHEHAYKEHVLGKEEAEYELADFLLCPSDFVIRTFLDQGYPAEKLVRHIYGYDDSRFFPGLGDRRSHGTFTMLFVGVAAVRKGLHFALDGWLRSPASRKGKFLIAGEILPAYERHLASSLSHPSVHVLGHRTDVPELMRSSDVLVLPSLEEGSALACSEALGSGCVPLVSDAASGVCEHNVNSLVHRAGDVDALARHITLTYENRATLTRLRTQALADAERITWRAAGNRLLDIYRQVVHQARSAPEIEPIELEMTR